MNDTTLQQKASTVCEPIAWDDILNHPATRFHPKSVRRYLFNVVEKLNNHLAIWMDGPSMCKLRIRRNGTQGGNVDVSVSVWRARQLFPWMVQCQWLENEKKKMLFRNVIDIFLAAKNRKEIYHTPTVSELPLRQSPAIEWLKTQLALPVECCSLKWAGLNPREWLYSSFLEEVKEELFDDWARSTSCIEHLRFVSDWITWMENKRGYWKTLGSISVRVFLTRIH